MELWSEGSFCFIFFIKQLFASTLHNSTTQSLFFMTHPDFKFIRATSMMIGGVIGVGVFGIPYAFAKSGFAVGLLELLVLAVLIGILQFMFAEIALQTAGSHRLVGYVDIYLGSFWKWVAVVAVSISSWGAMLAYMIVGGKFLTQLFPLGNQVTYFFPYVLAVVAGVLMYRGLQFASKLEIGVILALLLLFVFIILRSIPFIELSNFSTIHLENTFFPYGIILFALTSMGIVPEIKDVLGNRAKLQLGKVIVYGMISIVCLYALFAFAVVGVTGGTTTQAAFDGLIPVFGTSFGFVTSLLGGIVVLSAFMIFGVELTNVFRFDFGVSKNIAWLATILVPVIVYAVGVHEFINVIGFIGSVFGGLLGILIVLTYIRMTALPFCQKQHCLNLSKIVSWFVIMLFLGGIIFELAHYLL